MAIEVKNQIPDEIMRETVSNGKKIYILQWNNIIPENRALASEKIFFDINFAVSCKNSQKNGNKIIIFGEFDDKFWFFKVVKDIHEFSQQFAVNKPFLGNITNLKIYLIDWFKIIKTWEPQKIAIEYAVS